MFEVETKLDLVVRNKFNYKVKRKIDLEKMRQLFDSFSIVSTYSDPY